MSHSQAAISGPQKDAVRTMTIRDGMLAASLSIYSSPESGQAILS
jgi:hypothetical protein